ncbi:MAG: pseudouridine synthase, partial [Bacteroidales bacterium]
GTIEGNIGRSIKDRKVMSVFPNGEMGRSAITHYKVVERFGYVTLIECVLETGRTHQIRAHLKYLKHPLFNDETYGGDQILKGTTFSKYKQFIQNCFKLMPRQGLHAATLGFVHPTTHQFMRFENTIPKDMSMVLDKWRSYIVNKEYEEDLPLEPTSEEKIMNARLLNENN